jgi:hypothetical protein
MSRLSILSLLLLVAPFEIDCLIVLAGRYGRPQPPRRPSDHCVRSLASNLSEVSHARQHTD